MGQPRETRGRSSQDRMGYTLAAVGMDMKRGITD